VYRVPGDFSGSGTGSGDGPATCLLPSVTNGRVKREFSAGSVLVRRLRGGWVFAAIRPAGKEPGVWALPKGLIDPREKPEQTALREVSEETGAQGRLVEKLGDVRYVYTASWKGGARIFKVVSFFLLRAGRGRIGEIDEAMRVEVAEARWLPLDEAPRLLSYDGERKMAAKALEKLGS
jgi:8-oxo-dGTP pyrophosphatase MutT (NUDIX family)